MIFWAGTSCADNAIALHPGLNIWLKNKLKKQSRGLTAFWLGGYFKTQAISFNKIGLKGGSMMTKNYFTILFTVMVSALVIGCQAHTPEVRHPAFQPVDLNAQLKSGEYSQRMENFAVVLDASRSAGDAEGGQTSFEKAKDFLYRMNQTLPDMKMDASLRSFGHWSLGGDGETMLNFGPGRWIRDNFQAAVDQVSWGAGGSPVDQALDLSSEDMTAMSGKTAVIVIGDGEYEGVDGVGAARRLKERFGANACIYTVLVGGVTPESFATMRDIAKAGECGFYQDASNLESPQGMADWVREVFLAKGQAVTPLDTDGDGVADNKDQCPDTPKGDRVNNVGCTVVNDADADGVTDASDQCPGTPMGAPVNDAGCWVIANVEFDFDSAMIRTDHIATLNQIAQVLSQNPDVRMDISGHTCNIGTQAYNYRLSVQRAQSVAHYLRNKGVSPAQVSSQGFGLSYPKASNDTEWGRERNRRADFKWSR